MQRKLTLILYLEGYVPWRKKFRGFGARHPHGTFSLIRFLFRLQTLIIAGNNFHAIRSPLNIDNLTMLRDIPIDIESPFITLAFFSQFIRCLPGWMDDCVYVNMYFTGSFDGVCLLVNFVLRSILKKNAGLLISFS